MLCADVPFKGDTATKTLTMHVFTPVVPPSQRRPDLQIPPALEAVCLRAMQKKPAERFADLREMMNALERVETELRGGAETTGPRSTRAKPRTAPAPAASPSSPSSMEDLVPARKNRAGLYVGGAAAVALALFGTALAVSRNRTPAAASSAPVVVQPPALVPAAPVQPVPTAPAAPPTVEIALRTRPAGAEVLEGSERLGVSPLQLKRPRGTGPTTFVFRMSGFKDESREIVASGDKEIEVVLEPRRDRVALERGSKKHSSRVAPLPTPTPSEPAPPRPPKQRVSDLRNPFE
jgi:serine/threonine-protein kinase